MNRYCVLLSVCALSWVPAESAMCQHVSYRLRQPELVPPNAAGSDDRSAEPSPSDTPPIHNPATLADMSCEDTSCGCEPGCGCESGCCDSGGCGGGWGNCLGDCCLGEAWTLQGCLQPCCDRTYSYGGWLSMGYLSDNNRLSVAPNDLLSFEDNPDRLNLNQAWFYTEKLAESECCNCDWGYRFDILYGVDAQKTQAFGNADNIWDVSLDHGSYGWAMPQAYLEFAYDDWNVKAGHFFTIIGYEVIPVTGNFFYSHSYTMFNSEPFTHTGVLVTNTANESLTLYGGWTLGWDTAWDQNQGGSNFLGGFGWQAADDVKYTYVCTAGNLGFKGDGYSHSNVLDFTLSKNWHYVLQSDLVRTNFVVNNGNELRDIGVNQYLFYTLNDCWALGGRAEWWKSNGVVYGDGQSTSYQEITGGINYKPHANFVVRPEIRYNWTNESVANGTQDFNNTVFGIDAVMTF